MQFPEDWEQQWEIYLQKRKSDGKRRDYFGHPENEKIFLEKYPEILELVKDSIIVMSKAQ